MNVNHVSAVSNTPVQANLARGGLVVDKPVRQELTTPRFTQNQEQSLAAPSSMEELTKAVEETNKMVQHVRKNLRFSIHEDTKRVMVEVRDVDTDEVIKELPPQDFLDMIAKIREFVGLLIDEKI